MQTDDFEQFSDLIEQVCAFYEKPCSSFVLDVWWMAMKSYDLAAIRDALGKHSVNPDNGQWMPKPADVVRLIEGSTVDSALVAWTKIDRAIQSVGTYATVVFDDPIIHCVVADMGGWPSFGAKSHDEWPFVGKEFQTRYRGIKAARTIPAYPPKLVGISDQSNTQRGFKQMNPVLIGNPEAAKSVLIGGDTRPRLTVMNMVLPVPEIASKMHTDKKGYSVEK